MNVRLFAPGDGPGVDLICPPPHDIELDRDQLVVSTLEYPSPAITGVLAGRPAVVVHEMRLAPGALALERAQLLIDRGVHLIRGWGHRDAVFLVDPKNAAMLRFVESLPYKVVEQQPARIFWLKL